MHPVLVYAGALVHSTSLPGRDRCILDSDMMEVECNTTAAAVQDSRLQFQLLASLPAVASLEDSNTASSPQAQV